ncbi:HAD family hydrolase [Blastomonas fulva]|nr:HAD family hydrolase [Blastomonas fulva]
MNRTIVFDLDDTIYLESDYVQSGKRAVAGLIRDTVGIDLAQDLLDCPDNFIDLACTRAGFPASAADALIWCYRLHFPDIGQRPGMAALFDALAARGDRICIITDGRAVTQRLKLAALGLLHVPAYISEELGATKPSPVAFQQVMQDFPGSAYFYVADNCRKDFIGPNGLGWTTIWLDPGPLSIHRAPPDIAEHDGNRPGHSIGTIEQLAQLLLHEQRMP